MPVFMPAKSMGLESRVMRVGNSQLQKIIMACSFGGYVAQLVRRRSTVSKAPTSNRKGAGSMLESAFCSCVIEKKLNANFTLEPCNLPVVVAQAVKDLQIEPQ